MERGELEFVIRNKIADITSYISSDWPNIGDRKKLYAERAKLETELEVLKNAEKKARNKLQAKEEA